MGFCPLCHSITVSSRWAHGDHGGHGSRAQWSRLSHGWARSQFSHGEVTAQSQLGHSSITARSQLAVSIFSMITAQSWLGHSSITAQVTAQSRLAVTILVTVSSRWAVTVAIFFLMGIVNWTLYIQMITVDVLIICKDAVPLCFR